MIVAARLAPNRAGTILACAALAVVSLADPAASEPQGAKPQAAGGTIVAARAVRSQTVLTAADLNLTPGSTPGAAARLEDAVGLETRVALYPSRPVLVSQLGPPALVERNDLVSLSYRHGPLTIETEGRALGRAGLGERVRVMNLTSRVTVTGTVAGVRQVEAGP